MFDKMKNSKLMFWSVELLVIALLIFVSSQISFVFQPIATFFSTLFAPVLIAGFLYYMLNPLVNFIMKKLKVKKNLAVGLVLVLLIAIIAFLMSTVIPNLAKQVTQLASNLPEFVKSTEQWVNQLLAHPMVKDLDYQQYLDQVDLSFGDIMKNVVNSLSNGIGSVISSIASTTMLIVTVPFILFYMLKDGDRFVPSIERYLPRNHKEEIIELLSKMSQTISSYISGQTLECLFVAVATFVGYQLIGIQYAFLFGCIAGATNMIPYLGPYIGLAPAVMVTIFTSPMQAVLACVVVLIVQQIDGNIIYPMVIGKSLDIHPLTIILILLVAGNLAGLLGMILGVPFYAVCKTIFIHIFDIIQLNRQKNAKGTKIIED
ncbi:AI-2E family transporter [Vagococcus intermedius]|uniref:AI-2E family transporter n=1 Tax=Vagococcus intermedius TaxID=2991418 RepID=A0AAF0CVU3_9ENTE|nr:AI-2E family transporter [Vagococcus intermedius]WEG73811.1 AI-2E family transporter [Vagococcus intermedius]WEG75896.1 AI-2E family transporter [Vagococcus intermedius]